MRNFWISRLLTATILASASGVAMAHPGHGTGTLLEGLLHPFGLDHLLAMVAVGLWSVTKLPRSRAWQGPAVFLAGLAISAFVGATGLTLQYLEQGVSLSLLAFGLMLFLASRQLPTGLGLGLIGIAASLHGLAHGLESPDLGLSGYIVGVLITTSLLHGTGAVLGLAAVRWLEQRTCDRALRWVGTSLALAGVYLFSQLAG